MIFIHFIAVPSPKMLNLQVTVLWLCCEPQEQGWCSGEINCSQSPIFPRDRQDWALCVTGCHLAWVSKLFMGQGTSLATHQCGLGSNPGINAMWVEFVAGSLSLFLWEVFLWVLQFSLLFKNQHFQKSNLMWNAQTLFNKLRTTKNS